MDTGGKIRTGKILEQLSKQHEITLISNVEPEKDNPYLTQINELCSKFIPVVINSTLGNCVNCLLLKFDLLPLLLGVVQLVSEIKRMITIVSILFIVWFSGVPEQFLSLLLCWDKHLIIYSLSGWYKRHQQQTPIL